MPRDEYDDRDDDRPRRRRDEDDDRPRRRRRDPDDRGDHTPPKSNTGLILLIVGLVVGLPMLACGGFAVWAFIQGKKVVDQVMTAGNGITVSRSFLRTLEGGNVQSAYDMTSANFKAGMTKDKFEAMVKANPVLTSANTANYTSGLPTPTGTEPNRRIVVSFNIEPGHAMGGEEDEDEDDPMFKPKVAKPKGAKPNPNAKGIVATITLAEQPDKQWKVDGFTIP